MARRRPDAVGRAGPVHDTLFGQRPVLGHVGQKKRRDILLRQIHDCASSRPLASAAPSVDIVSVRALDGIAHYGPELRLELCESSREGGVSSAAQYPNGR